MWAQVTIMNLEGVSVLLVPVTVLSPNELFLDMMGCPPIAPGDFVCIEPADNP